MGILGFLTRKGSKSNTPILGNTTIRESDVLAPTSKQVSPTNVNFKTIDRATVIPPIPTRISQEVADALTAKALTEELLDKSTEEGYEAMARLLKSDTKKHKIHRRAQKISAEEELERKTEDVKLGQFLQGQRIDYAQLGHDYQRSERVAANTLAAKREAYSTRR